MSTLDDENPLESASLLYILVFIALNLGGLKLGDMLALYESKEELFLTILLRTAPLSLTAIIVSFFFRWTLEQNSSSSLMEFVIIAALSLFGSTWLFARIPSLGIATISFEEWKGSPANMLLLMLLNYYSLYQPYFFLVSLGSGFYLGWKLYPKFFELQEPISSAPAITAAASKVKRSRLKRKTVKKKLESPVPEN